MAIPNNEKTFRRNESAFPRTLDNVELFELVCMRIVKRGGHRTAALDRGR